MLPSSPFPGLVEFDPVELGDAAMAVARQALADGGPVEAVGIANQRTSTIVWDRRTGEPVGPGIGWQDLRTVGECLTLQSQGIRVSPNASATKVAYLLGLVDQDRWEHLAFGTVDTWLAWILSEGRLHLTDATNAGVTGLRLGDGTGWSPRVLDALEPARLGPARPSSIRPAWSARPPPYPARPPSPASPATSRRR